VERTHSARRSPRSASVRAPSARPAPWWSGSGLSARSSSISN